MLERKRSLLGGVGLAGGLGLSAEVGGSAGAGEETANNGLQERVEDNLGTAAQSVSHMIPGKRG